MLKNTNNCSGKTINLITNPKIIAIRKFVAGPATETFNSPHFWSLRLYGLIGTGFAQPKIGPLPMVANKSSKGRITEPKGSKCFKGFKVNLPACFAVGSPNQ